MKPVEYCVDVVSADCVYGWAMADRGIREIRVYLQDRQIGLAHLGVPRADVAAAYPNKPHDVAARSGFFFKMPPDLQPWTQPEARLVLIQDDGGAFELHRGAIIVPGEDRPAAPGRSPFPKDVASLLAAVNDRYASDCWTDALCAEAVEDLGRLVAHSSKEIAGLYPWLRYLKSIWASFEHAQLNFPRFGTADPFRKDAISAANSHIELFAIANHLYVLRSHALAGSFLEFGCFKGFSSSMLSVACRELNVKMEVFDSFEGLPDSSSGYYRKGEFAGSLEEVRRHVAQFGALDGVEFHRGFFDQTIGQVQSPPLCIWMDVDLATSSRDVMRALGLLPRASCLFSHECAPENFGPEGIRYHAGADDVIEPIVEAFQREQRAVTGRFIWGNTGAFWDRDHGFPVLPIDLLLRVRAL